MTENLRKKCTKCNSIKDLVHFSKNNENKDGLSCICKSCKNCYSKKHYNNNKEKRNNQIRDYQINHITEARLRSKKHYEENKQAILEKRKQNFSYHKNKGTAHYQLFPEKRNNYRRLYYNSNILFKLTMLLRARLTDVLKNNSKCDSTLNLVGCTLITLKDYLQKTAINNGYLNFDINNYSGKDYHVDHIIPCAAWNLKCSYHQKLCFNWSNLQILSAKENCSKGDTIPS
jgi:hypothetical protein